MSCSTQSQLSPPESVAQVRFPNFFIIGVQKGGTTSLHRYLHQHPDIYMGRRKGAHFFLSEGGKLEYFAGQKTDYWKKICRTWDDYAAVYERGKNQERIGETSIWYQYRTASAQRIHHYMPSTRIVSILRDPVERAFSQFRHHVRRGYEQVLDFEAALKADAQRVLDDSGIAGHYTEQGFYFHQLSEWLKVFDRSQLKVFLIEDLDTDSSGVAKELFQFLEVDDSFTPDTTERFNVGHVPLYRRENYFTKLKTRWLPNEDSESSLPRWKRRILEFGSQEPRLTKEARSRMIEVYREDILRLQDLIDRDLSAWLRA